MDYLYAFLFVAVYIGKEIIIRKYYRKPAVSRNGRQDQGIPEGFK
ncbi:hypothetical protein SAMN02799624_05327 [Paenibacillus sp. UNC496MF]|nr:hypothetical protein SAMN02799624_05327 [Paenibacillus sp. UNC496MF]